MFNSEGVTEEYLLVCSHQLVAILLVSDSSSKHHLSVHQIWFQYFFYRNDHKMALIQMASVEEATAAVIVSSWECYNSSVHIEVCNLCYYYLS